MLLEKLLEAPGEADWRPLGTPGGSWGGAGDSWRLPEAPVQQRQSLHALGAPEVLGEQDQRAAGWGPRERRPLDLFNKHLWSADAIDFSPSRGGSPRGEPRGGVVPASTL